MNNWMSVLGGLTTAIALGIFALTLKSRQIPQKRVNSDFHVLKYGDGAKALVIVLGTVLPTIALYLYSTGNIEGNTALVVLAIDALFVGYCGPEFFLTRIEFDSKTVYAFSAWRKPRIIPWSVIMACKYSPLKRWHAFDTFGYGSLRVSDFMEERQQFVAQFRRLGEESIDFSQAHSVI